MIRNAMVLIVSMFVIVFWPGHLIAAQQDPDPEAKGAATAETTRTATAAEQLSDQWSREMGVLVMTRADLDTSKIVTEWHAHVV